MRIVPPSTSTEIAGLAARRLSVRLLRAVLKDRRPFDDALAAARDANLEFRDRAFARAIATTALRRLGEIDHVLGNLLAKPLPANAIETRLILVAGAAQLLFLGVAPHAAINLAVDQAKGSRKARGHAGLVNAVLRRVSESGRSLLAERDLGELDTPAWLYRRWIDAYGRETASRIAAAHREEPPLDLSVKEDGIGWAARLSGTLLPWGTVRLSAKGPIENIDGYTEGAWWVQDAAAALPALLFGDVRGKRIVDLCAAPGGKTAQLASRGAHVTAVDMSASRLRRLRENLERLALGADIVEADAATWTATDLFDAVLLDAPCSATGTIRRNPDILHVKSAADITTLSDLQARLLANALALLKPGGTLVFSTCSLEPEEGERQIARVLQSHGDFALVPIAPTELGLSKETVSPSGMLRTLPFHGGGMDGFFAARLVKRA